MSVIDCSEKTTAESKLDEHQQVVSSMMAEVRCIESTMINEPQHGVATSEQSAVPLLGKAVTIQAV